MGHLFIILAGLLSFIVADGTPADDSIAEQLHGEIVARSFPSMRCVIQATEVDQSEISCECYYAYVLLVEPTLPESPFRYIIIALSPERALPIDVDDLASFTYSVSVVKSQACDRQVSFEPKGSMNVVGISVVLGSDEMVEGESKCVPMHDWYPVEGASLLPEEGTFLPGYLVRTLTWQEE